MGQVAEKAKGPAFTVGAAAIGIAGGMALKRRNSRKRILGVPLPKNLIKGGLDPREVTKTLGKASKQLGQTSKTVGKDMERLGDQVERVGKILS